MWNFENCTGLILQGEGQDKDGDISYGCRGKEKMTADGQRRENMEKKRTKKKKIEEENCRTGEKGRVTIGIEAMDKGGGKAEDRRNYRREAEIHRYQRGRYTNIESQSTNTCSKDITMDWYRSDIYKKTTT